MEEPIFPNSARTDRTGPHSSGRVYLVCEVHGSGCMGESVCQHGDMSTKCDGCRVHPMATVSEMPPLRMPPNLTRQLSAAKILPGMYAHIILSLVVACPQFCSELCFPWWFHPKILICLCNHLVFTKSVYNILEPTFTHER